MGVELFHAEGQTDRHDEANSRFSQSCHSVFLRLAHQNPLRTYSPPPPHLIILALTTRKVFDEDYSGWFVCKVTLCNKFCVLIRI